MKVQELIELLQGLPPEQDVITEDDEYVCFREITGLREVKTGYYFYDSMSVDIVKPANEHPYERVLPAVLLIQSGNSYRERY
jgi:hypothetical protein